MKKLFKKKNGIKMMKNITQYHYTNVNNKSEITNEYKIGNST